MKQTVLFKGNEVFSLMKHTVRLRETLCSVWQKPFIYLFAFKLE